MAYASFGEPGVGAGAGLGTRPTSIDCVFIIAGVHSGAHAEIRKHGTRLLLCQLPDGRGSVRVSLLMRAVLGISLQQSVTKNPAFTADRWRHDVLADRLLQLFPTE